MILIKIVGGNRDSNEMYEAGNELLSQKGDKQAQKLSENLLIETKSNKRTDPKKK